MDEKRIEEIKTRYNRFQNANDTYKIVPPVYIEPVLINDGYAKAWADLAAHSKDDIPWLLDQLEQAQKEIARLKAELGRCTTGNGTYISLTSHEMMITEKNREIELLKSDRRWIPVAERLPDSGQPVLVYWYEPDYEVHQTHICEYYRKGDVVEDEIDLMGDTPDERLLDVVLGGRGNKIIEQDGFYIFDCVDGTGMCKWRRHSDCITHWMPLPEPPEKGTSDGTS